MFKLYLNMLFFFCFKFYRFFQSLSKSSDLLKINFRKLKMVKMVNHETYNTLLFFYTYKISIKTSKINLTHI